VSKQCGHVTGSCAFGLPQRGQKWECFGRDSEHAEHSSPDRPGISPSRSSAPVSRLAIVSVIPNAEGFQQTVTNTTGYRCSIST
jgi:hypothetical protein